MDESAAAWITKISQQYAECTCGKRCHIDVTIRENLILFRTICPECGRVYTATESIRVVTEAGVDMTDDILNKVKYVFARSSE